MHIFNADPEEDDLGGTVDIVEKEPKNDHGVECGPREKIVYMTVNDSQQEDKHL